MFCREGLILDLIFQRGLNSTGGHTIQSKLIFSFDVGRYTSAYQNFVMSLTGKHRLSENKFLFTVWYAFLYILFVFAWKSLAGW